jgi:hypothetical protein
MPEHFDRKRIRLLLCAITFLTMALISATAPAVLAQTVAATDTLVKDAGDVQVKAKGARIAIPASWREYMVAAEFQTEGGENQNYRRVILYKQTGQANCSQTPCWTNYSAFALDSNTHEKSFKRSELSMLLVTSWGFNPNKAHSKGGAPYASFQTERITVNQKRGVKLTFSSGFGAGNTVVTLLPN